MAVVSTLQDFHILMKFWDSFWRYQAGKPLCEKVVKLRSQIWNLTMPDLAAKYNLITTVKINFVALHQIGGNDCFLNGPHENLSLIIRWSLSGKWALPLFNKLRKMATVLTLYENYRSIHDISQLNRNLTTTICR